MDDKGTDLVSGIAYASLSTRIGPLDTSSDLYTINLNTGAPTLVGSIGQMGGPGAFLTRDLAAPVGTPVPEPRLSGILAAGLIALAGARPGRTRNQFGSSRTNSEPGN